MFRLAEKEVREALVGVLREYHGAVIAPHHDRMQACVDAELAWRGRELLLGGVHGLLDGMGPTMRWKPPVLEVDYYDGSRDLHLNGRGLRLVPSYFCWRDPVPFADPDLPPVLVYPLLHRRPETPGHEPDRSLAALLGRTRAAVLNVVAGGATNSELARAVSVSPASATHHTTVLRDAGLIASHRHANTVLHTLTPAGAALLRPGLATADAGAGREVSR
jgi:DNA-binding transcriptional ArsR family regulator